eukprot:5188003-Amphidinium_carterae.1
MVKEGLSANPMKNNSSFPSPSLPQEWLPGSCHTKGNNNCYIKRRNSSARGKAARAHHICFVMAAVSAGLHTCGVPTKTHLPCHTKNFLKSPSRLSWAFRRNLLSNCCPPNRYRAGRQRIFLRVLLLL